MKKLLLSLVALLFTNVIFGQIEQRIFTYEHNPGTSNSVILKYKVVGSTSIYYEVALIGYEDIPDDGKLRISSNRFVAADGTDNYLIVSIGDSAFKNCDTLTSVYIPNNIKSIGKEAFYNCTNLNAVTYANNSSQKLASIGNSAFENCTNLTTFTIPNKVTSIGENAFKSCTSLTTVDFKPNPILTTIGDGAFDNCGNLTSFAVPSSVTTIGNNAFYNCRDLATVTFGDNSSLTSIGDRAFYYCDNLTSITIPDGVTTIGTSAFRYCYDLTSVNIPDGVTTIEAYTFSDCTSLTTITIPAGVTSIKSYAFNNTGLTSVICNPEVAPTLGNAPFASTMDTKTLTVPFGDGNYSPTWGNTNWRKVYYNINEGVVKTLSYNFTMTEKDSLINKGVLIIPQTYQLINTTNDNVNGIFEIETYDLPANKWSFIGAPLTSGTGKYKLETVVPKLDGVSVSVFDYNAGNWSEDWARITTEVDAGEGYFAWSWNNAPTIFTNYGDGMYSARTTNAQYANYSYDYSTAPAYSLNNGDVAVTKSLTYNQGNWMALANPYTFKLNVAMFINDNTSLSTTQVGDIQGRCIYRLNSTNTAFEPVFSGEIKVTEGFFVNFANSGEQTATFKKSQRLQNANKSSVERDFIKIVMIEGENESEVLFAQNEEAEQGYDILDANKMFSPAHVTEHYFVTENKPLVKEEVKTLPYYATMKVKSYERKEVSFKAVNVPEGMSVSIIDRDEVFSLNNGEVYSTNITIGENHNRFKVLFGSSVGLEDVKDVEVSFYPNPTKGEIAFSAMIERIEVIDLTGRVLLSFDNAREINISSLSSGAYYLRLRTNESVVMQKVIKE